MSRGQIYFLRHGLAVSSPERRHHFSKHPLLLPHITWREVKRLDAAYIGFSSNFSSSRGREMSPVPRQRIVRSCKRRIDEENIRVLHERNVGVTIGRRIGDVGDIANFLSGRDGQEITQGPKWNEPIVRNRRSVDLDQMIVRAPFDHGVLE